MRHLLQSHRCWSGVDERFVHSLLKLKHWTLPCQERFKFGVNDPEVCKTACFIQVLMHGACAVMRDSVARMLLIGKDAESIGSTI